MSNFLRYLQSEHVFEHDFEHVLKEKKKYSEPKIYDADGDLSKRWYVYFSFRKKTDGHLNEVLITTSAKNRNNTRTDVSSIFIVLADKEIISGNFIHKIPVLKSNPEKNKSYTSTEETKIFEYLDKNNKLLSLYVKFISYNFLRPVEVNRIKVGDIDLNDKILKIKTKTGFKLKRIPQVLIDEMPDIAQYPKDAYLFGRKDFGQYWEDILLINKNIYQFD